MVTLVVTIIVLIILAGISVQVTIGENGFITNAKQTKQNIVSQGEAEAIQLNQLYHDFEVGGELTQDEESTKKDEIIALLQKQIGELQKQVEALQTENAELKKQIQDLRNQIAQLQKEIEDLKKQILNKDIQIAEKQKKIEELTAQLNAINSLLSQTNATVDKILAGYKAYSGGALLIGTMPSNGGSGNVPSDKAWLYSNRVYFGIPYGYYPPENYGGMTQVSERYVTYASLANTIGLVNHKLAVGQSVLGVNGTYTSDATATANNLSSGVTAYVNGQKITGNGADVNNAYSNGYHVGKGAIVTKTVSGSQGNFSNLADYGYVRSIAITVPTVEGKQLLTYAIQSITFSNSNGAIKGGTFQTTISGNTLYVYSPDIRWSSGGTSASATVLFIYV